MTRYEEIARNIESLRAKLGDVQLCAVTKTMPVEDINAAIAAGMPASSRQSSVASRPRKRFFICENLLLAYP